MLLHEKKHRIQEPWALLSSFGVTNEKVLEIQFNSLPQRCTTSYNMLGLYKSLSKQRCKLTDNHQQIYQLAGVTAIKATH